METQKSERKRRGLGKGVLPGVTDARKMKTTMKREDSVGKKCSLKRGGVPGGLIPLFSLTGSDYRCLSIFLIKKEPSPVNPPCLSLEEGKTENEEKGETR